MALSSFSHGICMTEPICFRQALTCSFSRPEHILKALSALNHVVYLTHQQQPIIGCFAHSYLLIENQQQKIYQQTQFNTYQARNFENSFADFFSEFQKNSHHKLMGFISYDYAAQQAIHLQAKNQPALFLGCFSSYLIFENEQWIFESYSAYAQQEFDFLQQQCHAQNNAQFYLTQKAQARWNREQYQHAFDQIQAYIRAGDCYQINLTQEFTAKAHGLLANTCDAFWQLTNAPYSGYLRVDDFELLSCSPELFIDFQAHRQIVTKPIKGTMPRFHDPILDEQSKQKLKLSEKDQAENLMIVDLLRNDFGVDAEIGSVKTSKLFEIESFNQVHHLVSEIRATLKPQQNPLEVLLRALPGGSITGAPKIRAMQIIDELEHAPRGAYCGSMGYFNADGTGCWNILIRSIQKYQEDISLWAGGGITIASNSDAEYQECFDKISAMIELLNQFTIQ